jgi:predicted AlkP superfamily pyrophosphatase or phosphodiesterase
MKKKIYQLVSLFFVVLFLNSASAQDTTQKVIEGRRNDKSQYNKPYVILISADGFRADFTELYNAEFLKSISKSGVRAKFMTPAFPSLTFPNHYTIVTGMYPSHHGLVNNTYYDKNSGSEYRMGNPKVVGDGKWYGGTPLWVLAEQQKMLSASFYWVGSEADIQKTRPTYYYIYNDKINIANRIKAVKDWLSLPEDQRPHMITFYMPEVDHEAHSYGPNDPHVADAVKFVDSSVNALQTTLASLHLPINYIFVSDHGMTKVDNVNTLSMPTAIDTAAMRVPWGDALIHIYAKDESKIESTYNRLKKDTALSVYKLDETPDYWHFKKADDKFNRLGDLIVVPHLPMTFNFSTRKTTLGKHGYDNHHPDMRATFMAWGPAFKSGLYIDDFENVNVYPLVAKILGLTFDEKSIDGKSVVLNPILKPMPVTSKAPKAN